MKIIPIKICLKPNIFIYFSSSVIYYKQKYLMSKLNSKNELKFLDECSMKLCWSMNNNGIFAI